MPPILDARGRRPVRPLPARHCFASPFRTSSFFNIIDFYHYYLMHPLKNFYTPLRGTPQKCFQSGSELANAGHAAPCSGRSQSVKLYSEVVRELTDSLHRVRSTYAFWWLPKNNWFKCWAWVMRQSTMGAIWWGTRGTCPPHFLSREGHNMPCPPTFFSLGFVFAEVPQIKVMFVTFCVKSFTC